MVPAIHKLTIAEITLVRATDSALHERNILLVQVSCPVAEKLG